MKKLISTFLLLFIIQICYCQTDSTQQHNTRKTVVVEDPRIATLKETYQSSFKLKGYRIQIHSGNKRQPAKQARAKFMKLHNEIATHETYQQPNYKIRVGDFKSKIEALKFLKEITSDFPNSFIVSDNISFRDED